MLQKFMQSTSNSEQAVNTKSAKSKKYRLLQTRIE